MNNKIECFSSRQASEVFSLPGKEIANQITSKIKEIIDDHIYTYLTTERILNLEVLKREKAPHVMVRIFTIQCIIDGFKEAMIDRSNETLRGIGDFVGFTFAIDLISALMRNSRIPVDYEALLRFWSWFDTTADWGNMDLSISEDSKTITIQMENNFLGFDYKENKHRHCTFFEGYINAITDTLMLQWTRWIQKSVYKNPSKLWYSKNTYERPSGEDCKFITEIEEEKYSEARDLLSLAIISYQEGKLDEAVLSARRVIENLLRLPLGFSSLKPISFSRLIRSYKEAGVLLSDEWNQLYDQVSRKIHGSQGDTRDVLKIINCVRNKINEFAKIDLTDSQKTTILNQKGQYEIH